MMLWSKDFCWDRCCNVWLQVVTSKLYAGRDGSRGTLLLRSARLIPCSVSKWCMDHGGMCALPSVSRYLWDFSLPES